jgi:hypothetical protein
LTHFMALCKEMNTSTDLLEQSSEFVYGLMLGIIYFC